jgi:hypothetical protein
MVIGTAAQLPLTDGAAKAGRAEIEMPATISAAAIWNGFTVHPRARISSSTVNHR